MANKHKISLFIIIILIMLSGNHSMQHHYAGRSVLVTGGAGFIGSHLVHELVKKGARVTVLDNLSTGKLDNIRDVLDAITFIEGDITDYATCLLAAQHQEIIFHLAAFISVPLSVNNPRACHNTNVTGTLFMLEAARHHKISRFVFSSSAAVYGNQEGVCQETQMPSPESPYGFSKLIGELYCQQYAKNSSIKTVALRYFNVIGDGQDGSGPYPAVYTAFKQRMEHNEPLTIFGDGLQTRDFVPVSEVVRVNLIVGSTPEHLLTHAVYNVGTGTSITLLELINRLKQQYPAYRQSITFAPTRTGDVKHSQADCSRLRHLLQQAPLL